MPDRPHSKTRQFLTLRDDMVACVDLSRILFTGGSNDWFALLVQYELTIKLKENALRRWENLSNVQKTDYNFHKLQLLHRQGIVFLKRQIRCYLRQLELLFCDTSATTVYHSSILERLDKNIPHFGMLFAILNSYLQAALKKATISNKFGQSISFKFISVASQFHEAENQQQLFVNKEIRRGVMTHRTLESYQQLFRKMHDFIKRDIAN